MDPTRQNQYASDAYQRANAPQTRLGRLLVPRPLRGYRRSWLRDDVLAGLTVAALVIPLGLAFGELAGLPPVYGLYTSMVPVIVFGLLASSPQAVVGAEAALSGIVAATIAPLVMQGSDPVRVVGLLSVLVGLVCLLGAALKLGRLAQLISRTVFIGYLAGVAVSVSVSQVPKIVGGAAFTSDTLAGQLMQLGRAFESANPASVAIGVATIVAVSIGRLRAPRVPVALAVLAIAAMVSWMLDLGAHGVEFVGALPSGFPRTLVPAHQVSDVIALLPAAVAIALVGFADTTVVSQGFAARNGYRVSSTRDLAALGAADVASGFFGGVPMSASSSRTAVAEAAQARTQVAPIVSAVAIGILLLGAGGLVRWVPQPALGGIIAAVMFGLIEVSAIRRLLRGRRSELVVLVGTFIGVAAFGVLAGVGIAIGISLAVFIGKSLHPHDAVLGRVAGGPGLFATDERAEVVPVPGLLMYRFDAPLYFANVDAMRTRVLDELEQRAAAGDPVRQVIIDGSAITDMDFTACRVVEELAKSLERQHVELRFAELNHEVIERLQRDGLFTMLGSDAFARSLKEAEAAFLRNR
ncbi:MAG: SulP family inorganic anion transporter [Gaiellales bacterium]